MLTVTRAAERIGVSASLIDEWCSRGLLPHYRAGGRVLIDPDELGGFMAGMGLAAHVPKGKEVISGAERTC